MVDLAPVFDIAESLVRQAVTSAGTTIRVQTTTTVTDPVTLDRVESVEVHDEGPAIVAPMTGTVSQPLPGVELRLGDWRVVLTPDHEPPKEGREIMVVTSRDLRLPGRKAIVLGHVLSSAGAAVVVFARPERP